MEYYLETGMGGDRRGGDSGAVVRLFILQIEEDPGRAEKLQFGYNAADRRVGFRVKNI